MKFLSFVSLAILLAVSAYSQKFGMGIYGGYQHHTAPVIIKDYATDFRGGGSIFVGTRFLMDMHKIQVGLSFEELGKGRYSYEANSTYNALYTEERAGFSYEYQYYTVNAFANYKFILPGLYLFAGPHFGYYTRKRDRIMITYPDPPYLPRKYNYSTSQVSGISFGGQFGLCLKPGKHFGIQLEAGIRYLSIQTPFAYAQQGFSSPLELRKKLGYIYLPASFGISYWF